jgi:hypothetical protein
MILTFQQLSAVCKKLTSLAMVQNVNENTWKMIFQEMEYEGKQGSDKVDINCILIRGTKYQEGIMTKNVCTKHYCTKFHKTNTPKKISLDTIVDDFNTPLSLTDRSSKQKEKQQNFRVKLYCGSS